MVRACRPSEGGLASTGQMAISNVEEDPSIAEAIVKMVSATGISVSLIVLPFPESSFVTAALSPRDFHWYQTFMKGSTLIKRLNESRWTCVVT